MPSTKEIKKNAKAFAEYWKGKGYEKGESQTYWNMLLRDILGIEHPEEFIQYEDQVMLDKSTGFIDGYIPSSRVLIEQKSIEKDLRKAIKQSDGSMLTPFQQAKKYIVDLPVSKHPKWVITCNFRELFIYDMEKPHGEPEVIKLEDLPKDYYRLSFIADTENVHLKREMEVSIKAGELVGLIYDAFAKQYINLKNQHSVESLNKICVRIVFCLYAEDAGLFKYKNQFHDYLNSKTTVETRQALIDLFKVLSTPEAVRDPYMEQSLLDFPYVNGGLFAEEDLEIPRVTDEIRDLLITKASNEFDWSEISPTIFGAVFESTLNPETRRAGGMHYTSLENIHKVIDPLFLDDLKEELEDIKKLKQNNTIIKRVDAFQEKLANLTFLDPAAGSGNFLTETYISLRKLENEALRFAYGSRMSLFDPIKVSIGQFYGIEINDFAVSVAQTALWIAESQMMKETEDMFNLDLQFLPLKSFTNYVEGNALRMDWNDVVPASKVNFIMGNPPFSGTRVMSNEQKSDVKFVFGTKWNSSNSLDYVACWYKKCAEYIQNTDIRCGLVSTNSIVQGEQVTALWKPLFEQYGVHFDYAYKTFIWNSEATDVAHVHCVIIGFSVADNPKKPVLFSNGTSAIVNNIDGYLDAFPSVFVQRQEKPICDVPEIYLGCTFNDNNNLILTKEEADVLLKKSPELRKLIRPYIMGKDFIARKYRYCFWLKDADPKEITSSSEVMNRVENVRNFRLGCKNKDTVISAQTPTIPSMLRYYATKDRVDYVAIPKVSSQNRKYIPMDLVSGDVVAGDKIFLMPGADLFTFGVITSGVHMAWVRKYCGRLKSDFSYSSKLVYNAFPWPTVSPENKKRIEATAKSILEARNKYPDASLADLYGDHMYLYPELLKAHQENDKAVMEAYGFTKIVDGKRTWLTESETVAELMKMYQKLVDEGEKTE